MVNPKYNWAHRRRRAAIAHTVNAGHATCWRCLQPIKRGQTWHLGHDDNDPTKYRGPEHEACNCSRKPPTTSTVDKSRQW